MAFNDWNHDGERDFKDDFIEYQIYKDFTEKNRCDSSTPNRGSGISTFGAILCTIATFVIGGLIFSALGVDAENVPTIVVVIVILIVGGIIGAIGNELGL